MKTKQQLTTLEEARRAYGPGFYQADIGDVTPEYEKVLEEKEKAIEKQRTQPRLRYYKEELEKIFRVKKKPQQ